MDPPTNTPVHHKAELVLKLSDMNDPLPDPIPTWWNSIKNFFTEQDRACMKERFDLAVYEDVKLQAVHIYGQVANGWMPMGEDKWSSEKVKSLEYWIKAGCPFGTPPIPELKNRLFAVSVPSPSRLRKNLNELEHDEIELLKKAFKGIMEKDPKDENSYFHVASFHGLPQKIWCWHHFFGFLPWHRYYTLLLENALRSVPGCEGVTLPYWDLASDKVIPSWMWEAPFDSYTFQIDVGEKKAGTKTVRESWKNVTDSAQVQIFHELIQTAMSTSSWEDFADWQYYDSSERVAVEKSHDRMHGLTGGAVISHDPPLHGDMLDQEYTAYDPIFWFSHCDFDRLCWEWQKLRSATTEIGFLNTCKRNDLSDMYLKSTLLPWDGETFIKYLDLDNFKFPNGKVGIGYTAGTFSGGNKLKLHMPLHLASVSPIPFAIKAQPKNKVIWLKKLNRTKISGSFKVQLFAEVPGQKEKQLIDTEYVFQARDPSLCEKCSEKPIAKFAFVVKQQLPEDTVYSFEIRRSADNSLVDISRCGSPKLSIGLSVV